MSESAASSQNLSVEIAIVGAGLVGMPMAYALARQGWSVALLDARAHPSAESSSEQSLQQRCTALSLGTQQWLAEQGLWSAVVSDACPIEQVQVSHKGYFGSTRMRAQELGAQALGFVVNNDTVTKAFRVTLADGVLVSAGDRQLKAKLLIAADGVSSTIRDAAGIGVRQIDYDQSAVLGCVEVEHAHNRMAYERFTTSGPLALLPRPGRIMSFVDCIEPDQRDMIMALDDAQYRQRLQSRFGFRLGQIDAIGPRFVTPLLRIEANQQIARRTVLVGNAMRLLHPVGGQGYNLALRDVAALVQLLSNRTLSDVSHDPGSELLLKQFVRSRAQDQARITNLTDVLARSFRGNARAPSHARALALIGLDSITPLRKRFAHLSMGIVE